MKVFIISIVMWWGNLAETPINDAVEIDTLDGKQLEFVTQPACFEHVDENLEALKAYGHKVFPTANAVKAIYCLERERQAT